MHPLALMGLLATLGGILAAAVALVMVSRQGIPLGPVLAGNGIPLLVFTVGVAISIARRQKGKKATVPLYVGFVLTMLVWILLNV